MFKVTETMVAEHACEQEFREVLGHGHHGGKCVRWRPANENAHLERATFFESFLVVPCDVALDLVMQSAFFVRNVFISRNLDAVHAYVRLHDACIFTRACGDLRERDERSAV